MGELERGTAASQARGMIMAFCVPSSHLRVFFILCEDNKAAHVARKLPPANAPQLRVLGCVIVCQNRNRRIWSGQYASGNH